MRQDVIAEADGSTTGLVLVADDDPITRALARRAFTKDGHGVVLAENGEEACDLFAQQNPDVILLDVNMPIVGGFDACIRVRDSTMGRRTPILMLTASEDVEAVSRAYEAGATDFQTKPINWRVLRERVKYMLRAQRDATELRRLAEYDSLTGLINRATFRSHLMQGLVLADQQGQRLAVIFLDLDGFKEINDAFGHGFGDLVLKQVADRIAGELRSSDALARSGGTCVQPVASRFGGDEFTVCIADIPGVDAATAVADRLHAALVRPLDVNGREVYVTASTGVSIYPFDGVDADTLLQHADVAMYDAKASGRNRHAPYTRSMSTKASEKVALAGGLRRALEHKEFRAHFQPKVDIASSRIVGAEALMRWQHPERGLLPPLGFIMAAEEIGLGPQIGDWLVHAILAQVADWRRDGHDPPPIAMNLSNSQFHGAGLLRRVTDAVLQYGLEPTCLEVEITEDVVIQNRAAVDEVLAGFRALGIRTAIDDFGTGQSALSTVRGLPVDTLKVDRSFIKDLHVSRSDRAIAASIIDIGHHLDMTVIAEGVETEEQLAILESLGCDQAQGFLFSRALPPEEFRVLLEEGLSRVEKMAEG